MIWHSPAVAGGLKRRLRLFTLFLILFLVYHILGAVVLPPLLGWPTTAGEERKEFCLAEAEEYLSCVRSAGGGS